MIKYIIINKLNNMIENIIKVDITFYDENIFKIIFPDKIIIKYNKNMNNPIINGYFINNKFFPPKPYDSWIIGKNEWISPKPYPKNNMLYYWDEDIIDWKLYLEEKNGSLPINR